MTWAQVEILKKFSDEVDQRGYRENSTIACDPGKTTKLAA
jgi:hypothetical protein